MPDSAPFSHKKQIVLLVCGAFFAFAPFWAPHIQQVWGRNLFVTPDSMVLLGVTLLVSLLGGYLLPDFLVSCFSSRVPSPACPPTLPWQKSRYSVLWSIVYKLLAIGALLSLVYGLYLVNQYILHSFLSSADEHSCYFLAECLRKGRLYVDIPPLADFFQVVHVGMRDGKWFSVYPPGWPLIWAFGLQFNVVDWLNPVMSSLAVFFFFLSARRLFGLWSAVLGLVIMCSSPFFMFTAASYFSHATCLLCIGVFLYAFLRWRETRALLVCHPRESGDPAHGFPTCPGQAFGNDVVKSQKPSETAEIFWASLCTFAFGYGLMTRYLTMAAIAGPFLLYHYLPIFFDWKGWGQATLVKIKLPVPLVTFKRPQLRKSDWIAVGIIAAFMILIFFQNYLVTGKAFWAPNNLDKPWERLGFLSNYTPVDGLFYLVARVFYLMDWFAPAIVAAYLFIVFRFPKHGSVIPECSYRGSNIPAESKDPGFPLNDCGNDKKQLRTLFRLCMVFIAGAYFFYYSWGGNQWGPRYLWEGMPFLCIAVADWLVRLWRDRDVRVKKFVLIFVIMSLVTSGILFVKHAEFTEEASRQRRALYGLAEQTIKGPAIVFIHGFLGSRLVMAEEDAIRNSPFLDGRILYAHDRGERNKEVIAAYPGRAYYRGVYRVDKKEAALERLQH